MPDAHVVIIGGGPRAITLVERFATLAVAMPTNGSLLVSVIDLGEPGCGVHDASQPDYLWTNTLASQVTIWPAGQFDTACRGMDHAFLDWASLQGYQKQYRGRDVFQKEGGIPLTDGDYLPRQLLGAYLGAMMDVVRQCLPDHIGFQHVRDYAMDVEESEDGYAVILNSGKMLKADFVIIAHGHGERMPTPEDQAMVEAVARFSQVNENLRFYKTPYPVASLQAISPESTVGVLGLGLTAHDVLAALTVGRGGQYELVDGRLTYVPSGSEPKIYLASRETLPFAARAINQKGRTGRHSAAFFTPQKVRDLQYRANADNGRKLDFLQDLWPILRQEMAYAFRTVTEKRAIAPETFEPTAAELALIEDELWPLRHTRFSSRSSHRSWFLEKFVRDLAEAGRGNLTSGIKAATDVLRDCRDGLRAAVEFGALEPHSHCYFASEFNSIINRVSFGPPLRRNQELLALFEAGVVDLAGGPNTLVDFDPERAKFRIRATFGESTSSTWTDSLVLARLDVYSPASDARDISRNLLRRGLISPFRNGDFHPSGIAVERSLKVRKADGSIARSMWAIGCVVEGPHYYTHALPRTGLASKQTADAHVIVEDIFKQLDSLRSTTGRMEYA